MFEEVGLPVVAETRAGVIRAIGAPLAVERLDVLGPGPGEVLVRLAASGVCHTDYAVAHGKLSVPLPLVLGHEGAGVIEAVADDVTRVQVGDRVVLSWVPDCGECFFCVRGEQFLCVSGNLANQSGTVPGGGTRLRGHGGPVRQLGAAGTFSERTVVSARSVVKVPDALPLDIASLLGCAVMTGAGAALNTADIVEGSVVVVIGCGGVGLSAIQGARIRGAGRIIAVDRSAAGLESALSVGATDAVQVTDGDPASAIRRATGQPGGDVVIEAVGVSSTISLAVRVTRPGGETVLVGAPAVGQALEVPLLTGLVIPNRTIKGSWYGSSIPENDIPRLAAYVGDGSLDLSMLIGRRIPATELGSALDYFERGEDGRTVIVFDQ